MFESIMKLINKITKKEDQTLKSKDAAKERLHLVLMQDRANVSADFLDLMKQEIIEVIKKYIDIDEAAMDVRLTNKDNGDGTNGAPALYANIPIINIKDETRQNAKVESSKVEAEKNKAKEQINNPQIEEQKELEKVSEMVEEEKMVETQDVEEDKTKIEEAEKKETKSKSKSQNKSKTKTKTKKQDKNIKNEE